MKKQFLFIMLLLLTALSSAEAQNQNPNPAQANHPLMIVKPERTTGNATETAISLTPGFGNTTPSITYGGSRTSNAVTWDRTNSGNNRSIRIVRKLNTIGIDYTDFRTGTSNANYQYGTAYSLIYGVNVSNATALYSSKYNLNSFIKPIMTKPTTVTDITYEWYTARDEQNKVDSLVIVGAAATTYYLKASFTVKTNKASPSTATTSAATNDWIPVTLTPVDKSFFVLEDTTSDKQLIGVFDPSIIASATSTNLFGQFSIESDDNGNSNVYYTPNELNGIGIDTYTIGGSTIYVGTFKHPGSFSSLSANGSGQYNLNDLMGTPSGDFDGYSIGYQWYNIKTGGTAIPNPETYNFGQNLSYTTLYVLPIILKRDGSGSTATYTTMGSYNERLEVNLSVEQLYYILPNLKATSNTVVSASATNLHIFPPEKYKSVVFDSETETAIYGSFTLNGNAIWYTPFGTPDKAGVDQVAVLATTSDGKIATIVVSVVVFAAYTHSVIQNDAGTKTHFLDDSMVPFDNLPKDWFISYGYATGYNAATDNQPSNWDPAGGTADQRFYPIANLHFNSAESAAFTSSVDNARTIMLIHRATPEQRVYGANQSVNRGFGLYSLVLFDLDNPIIGYNTTTTSPNYGDPIYGTKLNGNYKLTVINNFNNTMDLGTFSISDDGRQLLYTSSGDPMKIGMDQYCFAYGNENNGVVTPVNNSYRLAYMTVFKPIDKAVSRGGRVTLEMEDLTRNMPYDAVLTYEYFTVGSTVKKKTDTEDAIFPIAGTPLSNDANSDNQKATVLGVQLNNYLSYNSGETTGIYGPGIHAGSPGWEQISNRPTTDGASIPTTIYAVRASVRQTTGSSTSILRAKTPAMPIFLWEHQMLSFFNWQNYRNGLVEVKFDYTASSVCTEPYISKLSNYNTGVDLIVRLLIYELTPRLDNDNLIAILDDSGNLKERKDLSGNVIFPSIQNGNPVTYYNQDKSPIIDQELINTDGSVKFLYPDGYTIGENLVEGYPVRTYDVDGNEIYRIEIETDRTGVQDDISDMVNFHGYVDQNGNYPLYTSNTDTSPNHFYKVEKATSATVDGFPANITDGANTGQNTASSRSYGTRIDANTMALYISAGISGNLISGYQGGGEIQLLRPQDGELRITKGICGELTEPNLCGGSTTTMYIQDFGGNRESDPVFINANQIPSDAAKNVHDAIEGSTYRYKSSLRSGQNLPYLDEGDYFLTKVTEGHGGGWVEADADHTHSGDRSRGYMMQVNAGTEPGSLFDYNIKDLCAGAPLTFTAWVKNTIKIGNGVADPIDLIFEVYEVLNDGTTGKLLAHYNTAPILNPGNITGNNNTSNSNITTYKVNDWKLYGFTFRLSEETNTVRLKIINNGPGSSGNDFAIDDISIHLCADPILSALPPGNPSKPCEPTELNIAYNISGAEEYRYYTWLYNSTGEINEPWVVVNSGILTPADGEGTMHIDPSKDLSADPESNKYVEGLEKYKDIFPGGFYRLAIGFSPNFLESHCYVAGEPIQYFSSKLGYTFLWTGKKDANWNDPANWMFYDPSSSSQPVAATTYPSICNDVYIPYYDTDGNRIKYFPVVKQDDRSLGDVPLNACKDIHFLYGGMIQNPQYLHYDRAYVDYNFGVLEPDVTWNADHTAVSSVNNRESLFVPVNKIPYSKEPMLRGQWHTIAAPLKKILTGDFSFSGKPNVWQRGLETFSDGNGAYTATWGIEYNNPEYELSSQENAMTTFVSQWAPAYAVGLGLENQSNLDMILGNNRLPYYSSPSSIYYASRNLHSYNSLTGKSTFLFYDKGTQNILYGWSVDAPRSSQEGYRFVFETTTGTTQDDAVYTIPVEGGKPILLGNPFMSQLDFDQFAEDNKDVLSSGTYYAYQDDWSQANHDSFTPYTVVPGATNNSARYIDPLKSVVVIPVETGGNLTFKVAQSTVTNDIGLRSSATVQPDILQLEVEGEKTGQAGMTLFFRDDLSRTNAPLLRMQDSKVPSIFALEPRTGSRNVVQYENGYEHEIIPLGVLASQPGEKMQIKVSNIENLNVDELYLFDKYLSKKQNLLLNNTYEYNYAEGMVNRFELQLVPTQPNGFDKENFSSDIFVYVKDKELVVSSLSSDPISSIEIVDILGKPIFRGNYNQTQVNLPLSIKNKVILVKVKTQNAEQIKKVLF